MQDILRVAVIQLTASADMDYNLENIAAFAKKAEMQKPNMMAWSENVAFIRDDDAKIAAKTYEESAHPALSLFKKIAIKTKSWQLVGSLAIKPDKDSSRLYNRSYLIDDKGNIKARYDKIHLFDVDLPNGESHRESDNIKAGDKAVLAKTPWGRLGMTICYDLRFPLLYRELAKNGAKIITVPAAFTVPTGKAHWQSLLRARAIENGCFIIASAQCGSHNKNRKTYGHSLIISPWGEIIAKAGDEPEIIIAELDLNESDKMRAAIPSLRHDRDFTIDIKEQ